MFRGGLTSRIPLPCLWGYKARRKVIQALLSTLTHPFSPFRLILITSSDPFKSIPRWKLHSRVSRSFPFSPCLPYVETKTLMLISGTDIKAKLSSGHQDKNINGQRDELLAVDASTPPEHKSHFTHEAVGAAAAWLAMDAYQNHQQTSTGGKPSHAESKKVCPHPYRSPTVIDYSLSVARERSDRARDQAGRGKGASFP